jgi:hypothetical protein
MNFPDFHRGDAIEKIDHAGFQRILGANYHQFFFLDQLLEHLLAVAQMVAGKGRPGQGECRHPEAQSIQGQPPI